MAGVFLDVGERGAARVGGASEARPEGVAAVKGGNAADAADDCFNEGGDGAVAEAPVQHAAGFAERVKEQAWMLAAAGELGFQAGRGH